MRTFLLFLSLAGCLVQPPPEGVPDGVPNAEPAATPPAAPKHTVVVEDPKAKPRPAFEPPPPPAGLEGVDIVGHGLRITVFPPFQISRNDDFVSDFVEKDAKDGIMVSWWNVADPAVGRAMGMAGLHNAGVAVHPVPEGDPQIVQTRLPWPDGTEGVAYRLGETGSYVLLPKELTAAGGMLKVAPGPAEPVWAMEVDGVRTPLVARKFVHSADPASGSPFDIDGNPHKPWGPWPESAP